MRETACKFECEETKRLSVDERRMKSAHEVGVGGEVGGRGGGVGEGEEGVAADR